MAELGKEVASQLQAFDARNSINSILLYYMAAVSDHLPEDVLRGLVAGAGDGLVELRQFDPDVVAKESGEILDGIMGIRKGIEEAKA